MHSVAKAQNDTALQIEKHNAGMTTVTCEELRKDMAALGGKYLGTLRHANRGW